MTAQNKACIVDMADTPFENGRVPGGATVMQIQVRAARDAVTDAITVAKFTLMEAP
ncbi:MAG: hypothetical protein O2967_07520 [Proteobacteria bacterium]|nr:hypothetical protein [Pseudomonadota bacterium]